MPLINLSKEEFENKLKDDFPLVYRDLGGDPKETCMAWGICIGPGWFDHLYYASIKLEEIAKKSKNNYFKAEQVKEKFASIRFYHNAERNDRIFKEVEVILNDLEEKCKKTCEECGKEGKLYKVNGWYRTLCEKDLDNYNKGNQNE